MTRVSRRFFEQMHEDPPEIHRWIVTEPATWCIQRRFVGNDCVHPRPRGAVRVDRGDERVARLHIGRRGEVITGEAMSKPEYFRVGEMLRQPQQREIAPDEPL